MKKMLSLRASELTIRQINELSDFTGLNKTELLAIAINNLYSNEIYNNGIYKKLKKEMLRDYCDKKKINIKMQDALVAYYEWEKCEMGIDRMLYEWPEEVIKKALGYK